MGYVHGIAKALRKGLLPPSVKVTANQDYTISVDGTSKTEVEKAMGEYESTSSHHCGVKFKYSIEDVDASENEKEIEERIRKDYGNKIAGLKTKQESLEKRLRDQKNGYEDRIEGFEKRIKELEISIEQLNKGKEDFARQEIRYKALLFNKTQELLAEKQGAEKETQSLTDQINSLEAIPFYKLFFNYFKELVRH